MTLRKQLNCCCHGTAQNINFKILLVRCTGTNKD